MEDNYFDKKLKGILESPPDIPVDPLASQDMLRRLRASKEPKRKRFGLMAFLPLLLLPFLVGGGYLLYKVNNLNHQLISLHQQLNNTSSTIQIDTITNNQIIHQFDTIYRVVYQKVYLPAETTESNNITSTYPSYYSHRVHFGPSPYIERGWRQNTNLYRPWSLGYRGHTSLLALPPGSSLFDPNSPFNLDPQQEEAQWSLLDPLAPKSIGLLDDYLYEKYDSLFELENIHPPTRRRIKPSYYFIPTGFSVAAYGSPSYVYPQHDFGGGGSLYGLSGKIHFAGNRSLNIGVELLRQNFEAKQAAQIALFPVGIPDDPADILAEVKTNFSYLQIPVTLEQRFSIGEKFRPSIQLGFVAYQPIKQQFTYEFVNASIGEYKNTQSFNDGDFSFDNLRLGAGLDYALTEKLTAGTQFTYQHGFSQAANEYFNIRFWAIQFGLQYEF